MSSTTLRIVQIFFAVLSCLLCAGVVFGFAALKPVLIQEGVYSDLCLPGERERDADGQWNVCLEQDTRLNLMFTLSTVVTNVVCLPVGYTLDTLGPRKTSILGAFVFGTGALVFGLGYRSSLFDSYIVGYLLLAIGGPLIFLPQFISPMPSPNTQALPFVFYRMAYEANGGAVSVRMFFWVYMVVPFAVILEQLTIAPKDTYQRLVGPGPVDVEASPDEVEAAAPDASGFSQREANLASMSSFWRIDYGDAQGDDEEMVKELAAKDPITGIMYGLSAKEQICSKWFVLLTIFVCIHMTRINFYVMSIDSQLAFYTGNSVLADKLTVLFTIVLPLGGAVGIPFIGILLDYRPFFDVLGVLGAMGLTFGLLGMTPVAWIQIIGICTFCVFRPLMYTAVSDAYAKVFGFQHFGTVYGLTMTISGLVGLVNSPLDLLVKRWLHDNFFPIGITFVVAGLAISSALMVVVWRTTRKGAVRLE